MKYFLLILFFLQSCAQISLYHSETDRLILLDQYLSEQEFGEALNLIAETPKEYPHALELEKKRKMVIDKLRTYEKQTITHALKQERNNEWPAAKSSYEEALQKSGHSRILEDAQQAMLLRFQEKMDTLEREELIVTGEWLQKKLPLLRDLHTNDPGDRRIKWRYHRAQNDTEEIALQLSRLGEQMLADKNLAMARRVIPLVVELAPGPEADAAMERLKTELQARTLKKQKKKKKVARKTDKKNIESFNKAMAYEDFDEARYHLSQLTPAMQKSMAVELMQERLEREMAEYIQKELLAGDSFYRSGDYEQAINAWQNIIDLEPEYEAVKGKRDRAAIIVEKLKTLRERQIEEPGVQKKDLN